MVLIVGLHDRYTGVQLLDVKSSWKSEALYLGLDYSHWLLFIRMGVGVPSLEEVNKAHADLKGKPNVLGVVFSHYGYVSKESLPRLRRKCMLFDLADRMRHLNT